MTEFHKWAKIPRFKGCHTIITEKIDGTNGAIIIEGSSVVKIQSRNRFITPEDDNHCFARFVRENEEKIVEFLGEGVHHGEWAGPGIQGNPRKMKEKTFFLFNVWRWCLSQEHIDFPDGISVVPFIKEWFFFTREDADQALKELWARSLAEEYEAEGIVLFHVNTRSFEKYTFAQVNGQERK